MKIYGPMGTFTSTEVVNFYNICTWAPKNPYTSKPYSFQYQLSINVWAGIVDDNIVGPYSLPHHLDGAAFFYF